MAIAPPHLENGMKRLPGKFRFPGLISVGQPIPALINSMGLSAAKPTNGIPVIFDGVTKVNKKDDPDYHFTTDMTNEAIDWVKFQQAMTPEKPFFVYYATGATHAPHHVPKEWIEKYRGKFDQGWLKYREETFARQKAMGVIPENTKLAPMPKDIKEWEKLSANETRTLCVANGSFCRFYRAY